MTYFFIACGVALFVLMASGIAVLLVVAHAADGYERLIENEGVAG